MDRSSYPGISGLDHSMMVPLNLMPKSVNVVRNLLMGPNDIGGMTAKCTVRQNELEPCGAVS